VFEDDRKTRTCREKTLRVYRLFAAGWPPAERDRAWTRCPHRKGNDVKYELVRGAAALMVAAVAGLASPWAAANWGLAMRDSPARDFDDEDSRQFLAAVRQVLEAPPPPQPLEWRNQASGAGGTLLVIGQPKRQGFVECRRVRATLHSRRRQGQPQVWTACRQESGGSWKLVSAG